MTKQLLVVVATAFALAACGKQEAPKPAAAPAPAPAPEAKKEEAKAPEAPKAEEKKEETKAPEAPKAEEKKRLASRKKNTHPSRELAAYAGTYNDPAYGNVTIEAAGKQLRLKWSGFAVDLEHFHFETFTTAPRSGHRLEREAVVFRLDRDGNVEQVHFLKRTFRRAEKK